jgi:chromatin remodeling complex protein RSC6
MNKQSHMKRICNRTVNKEEEAVKAIKRDARDSKKRRRKDPADMTPEEKATWEARRANNAFLKLRPITDELATFMGLPSKSQKSQTDVTKYVSTYVKAHNCFDPNFKRRIIPDAKLGKLLRVKDGQEVTYLNLQSFLKVHFIKPAVTA